jgi:hypothetical protein
MSHKFCKWMGLLATLLMTASSSYPALAQYSSTPVDQSVLTTEPYRFTGIAMSRAGSGRFPCSGAVVADTRLLFSAAHCVFDAKAPVDANPWRPTPEWFSRYHASTLPVDNTGRPTRGYWIFTNYADVVRSTAINSAKAFDLDFIAAYAFEPLSESASGYWTDGYQAFIAYDTKQTIGYPSGNYPDEHAHKYLMHHNGPWTADCETLEGSYLTCQEVTAGKGNSGGPVFVKDPNTSRFFYAGVLVSGLRRAAGEPRDSSGINAIRDDEWKVVEGAKKSAIGGSGSSAPPTPTPQPGGGQRLGVYGNSQLIPNGKSYASRSDMTEFGSVSGSKTISRTFMLSNYGSSELRFESRRAVLITGRSRRYFRAARWPSSIPPQQVYPLKISFRASPRGQHRATVYVFTDDPVTPSYAFSIAARGR